MILGVLWGEVTQGLGLIAYGLAFGFFVRWQYTDPARRERNLRRRARALQVLFRRSDRRIQADARRQVFLARWVMPVFGIVFAALAASLVVHGLTH